MHFDKSLVQYVDIGVCQNLYTSGQDHVGNGNNEGNVSCSVGGSQDICKLKLHHINLKNQHCVQILCIYSAADHPLSFVMVLSSLLYKTVGEQIISFLLHT